MQLPADAAPASRPAITSSFVLQNRPRRCLVEQETRRRALIIEMCYFGVTALATGFSR